MYGIPTSPQVTADATDSPELTTVLTWNDDRDAAFFRLTGSLFSAEFAYGAGVLLASYDDE